MNIPSDPSQPPLHLAILQYFQWIGIAPSDGDKRKGALVVEALLQEFPELEPFKATKPTLLPELKNRYESFPSHINQLNYARTRIMSLEGTQMAHLNEIKRLRDSVVCLEKDSYKEALVQERSAFESARELLDKRNEEIETLQGEKETLEKEKEALAKEKTSLHSLIASQASQVERKEELEQQLAYYRREVARLKRETWTESNGYPQPPFAKGTSGAPPAETKMAPTAPGVTTAAAAPGTKVAPTPGTQVTVAPAVTNVASGLGRNVAAAQQMINLSVSPGRNVAPALGMNVPYAPATNATAVPRATLPVPGVGMNVPYVPATNATPVPRATSALSVPGVASARGRSVSVRGRSGATRGRGGVYQPYPPARRASDILVPPAVATMEANRPKLLTAGTHMGAPSKPDGAQAVAKKPDTEPAADSGNSRRQPLTERTLGFGASLNPPPGQPGGFFLGVNPWSPRQYSDVVGVKEPITAQHKPYSGTVAAKKTSTSPPFASNKRKHPPETPEEAAKKRKIAEKEKKIAEALAPDPLTWDERFEQLTLYQKANGNCEVPHSYKLMPGLGPWVANQRRLYKMDKLEPERVAKLLACDLDFGNPEFFTWEESFESLREFRLEHGHFRVPRVDKRYKRLRTWVGKQRIKYRDKTPFLVETDRAKKLEDIGFDFAPGIVGKSWEERFKELEAFHEINGHCNVPLPNRKTMRAASNVKNDGEGEQDENEDSQDHYKEVTEERTFATWVFTQRRAYERYKQGNRDVLTEERFQKLDKVGIGEVFESDEVWKARMEELRLYLDYYGDTNVPHDFTDNLQLARFVNAQRRWYRRLIDGEESPLTPPRVKELESLGFWWGRRTTPKPKKNQDGSVHI